MSIIADLAMPGDRLLTSKEVAAVFRVDPKTVVGWAHAGALTAVRTPGGKLLRFWESAVYTALRDGIVAQADDAAEAEAVSV